MSELIQVFDHTTTTGALRMVMLKTARASFERRTKLPANWKKARVAIIFSFRGLASETAPPVAESYTADGTPLCDFQIGLSNGAGLPVTAGVKFVGVGKAVASPACLAYSTSFGWQIGPSTSTGTTPYLRAYAATGTSIFANGTGNSRPTFGHKSPLATTDFASGLMLEIDATTAGSLVISTAQASGLSCINSAAVALSLMSLLTSPVTAIGAAITGCWWDNSSTFVGCDNLFIRAPWINSRLVVLGYEAIGLA